MTDSKPTSPSSRTRALILVRHGETVYNVERRFQGQTDIPLSANGRAQSLELRRRLRAHVHLQDVNDTLVVSSDLVRAKDTAELAFGASGRVIRLDAAMREFRFGVFEGLTRDEIVRRYPDDMKRWLTGDEDFTVVGGESRKEVFVRASRAVDATLETSTASSFIFVSHGGVMRQLLRRALPGDEASALNYSNCAAHVVHVDGPRWTYEGEV